MTMPAAFTTGVSSDRPTPVGGLNPSVRSALPSRPGFFGSTRSAMPMSCTTATNGPMSRPPVTVASSRVSSGVALIRMAILSTKIGPASKLRRMIHSSSTAPVK